MSVSKLVRILCQYEILDRNTLLELLLEQRQPACESHKSTLKTNSAFTSQSNRGDAKKS